MTYHRTFLALFAPASRGGSFWARCHLDGFLLSILLLLTGSGLFILYSASNQNLTMVIGQGIRFLLAFALMIGLAQLPPEQIKRFAPWFYLFGVALLGIVFGVGVVSKGAQRWLSIGLFRFQPSELIKIAVPLMLAWYLSEHALPPRRRVWFIAALIIGIPALLVAKQPDLGTALLIACAGGSVLLLAGLRWRTLLICFILLCAAMPVLWHHMHAYQRERVLTFLHPERDPLGAGYHIMQSKIAIGSGGIVGKGWLNGTQSHLQFLPEHATDFIFAVCSEELGLIGDLFLIILYILLIARGFYISFYAQDTFSRLLAGSISLMFFFSAFINMGMVAGILPVVGLPLPLISYGGTSMVTLLASFGLLMSIQGHRRLVGA